MRVNTHLRRRWWATPIEFRAAPRILGETMPGTWIRLLLMTRVAAGTIAILLLAAHRVTEHDQELATAAAVYVGLTTLIAAWRPKVLAHPVVWLIDIVAVLVLVALSSDWRSPFYLLALTTLAPPAAAVAPRAALGIGVAFSALYVLLGRFIGPDPLHLGTQASVETLATHALLPVFVAFAVSYAAESLRHLREERRRAERLAIESERRRIAFELHDSAKQRVHAAHLVLSAIADSVEQPHAAVVAQVLDELRAAGADMDTSLAELRLPLEGRPLEVALRERAREMTVPDGPEISVTGQAPPLAPLPAAHAYRVASEALTNAVRHAEAHSITVELAGVNGHAIVRVTDDGAGMPAVARPGSTGLRAMHNRAQTIGGTLAVEPGPEGRGTRVQLSFPVDTKGEPS
jgi:signal transduction histidine kinase